MGGNKFLFCKIWQWFKVAAIIIAFIPVSAQAQRVIINGDNFQDANSYTQQQLDQMLAPIALYPDALLAQILMASTYPLEVVEANRWLQQPANAALKGDGLAAALERQPWDASVKSLAAFPNLINMMDGNLEWTEDLGDAFLENQAGVMDSVQRLRWKAQLAGTLKSTPQQSVLFQNQDIIIEPANPQIVYVPSYDPSVIYGNWPYPDYPPFYFSPPANVVYYDRPLVNFGLGIVTASSLWAWDHWDWRHRRINIDNRHFHHKPEQKRPPAAVGVWSYSPGHNPNARGKPPRNPENNVQNNKGFYEEHRDNSRSRPRRDITPDTSTGGRAVIREPVKNIENKARPQNNPEIRHFERGPDKSSPDNAGMDREEGRSPYSREPRQPEKKE
jgi:hypothetical protein